MTLKDITSDLHFTTHWTNSADDKLVIFFFIFSQKTIWHFMQIVSIGDNLHEMSNSLFSGKNKNISRCCQWKILPEFKALNYTGQSPPKPQSTQSLIDVRCLLDYWQGDFHIDSQRLAFWVKISADYIFKYYFFFFPENKFWHFMQIVSLHERSDPVFLKK